MARVFRWTRLIPCKWEDSWLERLEGTGNVVVTTLAGSRTARLEVYCGHRKAQSLLEHFGGKVSLVEESQWKQALEGNTTPIPIRGKFLIHQSSQTFSDFNRRNKTKRRSPRSLFFPAEMAFGSGSHATTASCLRMLCDLSMRLPLRWSMLDLGTGSGILAVVASALGAGRVLGVDFDPVAVRIARSNWLRNRATLGDAKPPSFEKRDVLENFPSGKYEVVCANLFAELLVKIAPRVFESIEDGGWWIFSGILAEQMAAVAKAVREAGFTQPLIRRRGKWMAGIVQKPD